jgi:AraC-like DNA-binding protein
MAIHDHPAASIFRGPSAAPALLDAYERLGGDAAEMLRSCGFDCSIEDLRSQRLESVCALHLMELYRNCILACERATCELESRPTWPVLSQEVLTYCLIGCPNLSEALARSADFFSALAPRQCELSTTVSGTVSSFRMDTKRSDRGLSAFVADLCGLVSFQRLFSWLIGEELVLTRLDVIYPDRHWSPAFIHMVPYRVRFSQPHNQISFPSHYLSKRIVRSYADFVRIHEHYPWNLVLAPVTSPNLASTVRALLHSALRSGTQMANLPDLAKTLGCSERTLRRHMHEEGVHLNRLKSECRMELAIGLLTDSKLSVEEIAERACFSDAVVFRRAFKRWTGTSPSGYRHSDQGT